MTSLIEISYLEEYKLELHFSNNSYGVIDFKYLLDKNTSLTNQLKDIAYFKNNFIDFGALCWKNGLEFSAESLYEKLVDLDTLIKSEDVA